MRLFAVLRVNTEGTPWQGQTPDLYRDRAEAARRAEERGRVGDPSIVQELDDEPQCKHCRHWLTQTGGRRYIAMIGQCQLTSKATNYTQSCPSWCH